MNTTTQTVSDSSRPPEIPEALPAADAARLLGVSRATFFKLHSAGRVPLPVYLTPRCPRWRRSELLAWLGAGCPDRQTWQRMRGDGQ